MSQIEMSQKRRVRAAPKSLLALGLVLSCLSAFGQSVGVTLAWDPNSEPDLAGYHCYYSALGNPPVKVNVGLETRVTLVSLIPGKTYSFYVTAYNVAGLESEPSEVITYTIPKPKPRVEEGLRLEGLTRASTGRFRINAHGEAGRLYELQATEDLAEGEWVTVRRRIAGATGAFTMEDPAMNFPRRFYRVVRVE